MIHSHPNQVFKSSFYSVFVNGVVNSLHNMEQLPAITLPCFAKHVSDDTGVRT